MKFIGCISVIAWIAALTTAPPGFAQDYPAKPIRVIVGYPAGTTTDTAARLLTRPMQDLLRQTIIVEPRPGANGGIGANAAKNAQPDGYTIFFGSVTNLTATFTKANPVDAGTDFAPISDSLYSPQVLLVTSKLNVQTLDELIAHAKNNPAGTLNNAVTFAAQDLIMHTVKNSKGLTYTNIPFTNFAQFLPLMAKGEIAMHVNLFGNAQSALQAQSVRALFVTAAKRMSRYPDVPTAAELGVPGLERAGFSAGFWAPRGIPAAIGQRLSEAAQAAARNDEVQQQFAKLDYEAVGSTAADQLRNFTETMRFFSIAAKSANYQPQ